MATSLQQQLAAIAAKSSHELDLKAQRTQHSQSLLFEPKQAANQTFEYLYQIALDGFEELCRLDSRFTVFADTLFSEQSKSEDRTQMTAAENEELNTVIIAFLGLVSGRLLLRPAQKTLEWLVRRFKIHEYNTDHFIISCLPWHNDNLFPTILSLVSKSRQLSPALKFLQPYIKSLSSPPRHAIVNTANNNQSFFSLLNRFILTTAERRNHTAALFGFWASIVAQAINGQLDAAQSGRSDVKRQREEDVLLRILPVLEEGFQIKDVPELFLGCCMITVILATKTDLDDKVLDTLIDTVCSSWTIRTVNDGLACISILAQQKTSEVISKIALRTILDTTDIMSRLDTVSQSCTTDRLYLAITSTMITNADPQDVETHRALLIKFIERKSIPTKSRQNVAETMILYILGDREESGTPVNVIKSIIRQVCQSMEGKEVVNAVSNRRMIDAALLDDKIGTPLFLDQTPSQIDHVSEGDVDMQDATESGPHPDLKLEDLADDIRKVDSFFVKVHHSLYHKLFMIFDRASLSKSELASFNTSRLLNHETILQNVPYTSFLMRTWISGVEPDVKAQALVLMSEMVRSHTTKDIDLQNLLPLTMLALGDPSNKVRRAASGLLVEINQTVKNSAKVSKPKTVSIFGKDNLYGPMTKNVKYMKTSDWHEILTESITDNLEECVVDSSNIERLVISTIEGSDDGEELKSSTRSAFYSFLASHAVSSPSIKLRTSLFKLITSSDSAIMAARKAIVFPAVKDWICLEEIERGTLCGDEVTVAEADATHISMLTADSDEALNILMDTQTGVLECSMDIKDLAGARLRKLWPNVEISKQSKLSEILLAIALGQQNDIGQTTKENILALLKQLKLPGEVFVKLLQEVHDLAAMPMGTPAAKRRRTSGTKTRSQEISQVELENVIRRVTVILDLLESSKPKGSIELLKQLFKVLGDLQQIKAHLGLELVYVQQMTLSSILSSVASLKGTTSSKIDGTLLRTDLVVDCMRSTSNTQVHNSALLLISVLAGWVPDLVLHSVMPIFTFMSSTILRQGDDYSAHIIDQTMSQVIPPLVSSLRKKNQDLVTGAAELLLSFVAAFEHIPMHRRRQLFKHLVDALGPEESLSAVMAMLFERHASDQRVPGFCAELAGQYSASIQIKAVIQYIDLVADAVQPKRTVSNAIFSFEKDTVGQIEHKVSSLLNSLSVFLREGQFSSQIKSEVNNSNNSTKSSSIEKDTASLIDRSIAFSKSVQAKPVLQMAGNAVVAAVLDLLPTSHFARSVAPLLESTDDNLCSHLLTTLESRARSTKTSDASARTNMIALTSKISAILERATDSALKLQAISCSDAIIEKYGKKDVPAVIKIASVLAGPKALGQVPSPGVQVMALFTLASVVEVAKDEMISLVPQILNDALNCLENAVVKKGNGRLCEAAYSFLTSVFEYLSWTVSSTNAVRLVRATIAIAADSNMADSSVSAKNSCLDLAVKKIDARILLGAIQTSVEHAYKSSVNGCSELIRILDGIITNSPKTIVVKHNTIILSVLQELFDVRNRIKIVDDQGDINQGDLLRLDGERNELVMKTIMKLNDTLVRPFFVNLIDWATTSSSSDDDDDDDQSAQLRQLSVYNFLDVFFSTLKSLVTSYATYILDHSASIISPTSSSSPLSSVNLLNSVLLALSANFSHDQSDFWQAPSHFSQISQPLLKRLSSPSESAVTPLLISTITKLATAASSPENLKSLLTPLLSFTKDKRPLVRLNSVQTCRALTSCPVGEDWLSLLPEMLPFIAEMQEDEDERVEEEVVAWIREIEGILGEGLEGMLQ